MFRELTIELEYVVGQKRNAVSFCKDFSNRDLKAFLELDQNGNFGVIKVSLRPEAEITIDNLSIKIPYSFQRSHKIFVNGYQSWTDSREMGVDDKLKKISKLTAPILEKYQLKKYGDYTFQDYSGKRGEFHGYTYTYMRDGAVYDFIGSLSEREGFTIIEQDTKNNGMRIRKECKGLKIRGEYTPFQIFYARGSETEVFDGYFDRMGVKKPASKPSVGWTSWYNYYQNINQEIILVNLDNFKKYNRQIDIFQIDDGYQTAVGDWLSTDKTKFPKGMAYIADKIKDNGYQAGIWLAPFVCETNSKIFQEKKDWILKDQEGKPVLAGCNWSKFYALDFYHPEVREYIRRVFTIVLEEWGYDMVKLDFLYAVCLLPREDKTRGQIMTEAMEFLRKCVGDKLILGCGVPIGPAFGLVDYCRIGCDVSLDWNDKLYMRFLLRERVSTKNAIWNSIGRRQLNHRAFLNDPDVFLLREDNIKLNDHQKETLAVVNNLFGSLLFTSDNLKRYHKEQFAIFDQAIQIKNRVIMEVERDKNDLIKVVFTEDEKKFLLLINMSPKTLSYKSNENTKLDSLAPYSSRRIELT